MGVSVAVVKPGIYQHFKGPTYRVIGLSRHSETEAPLVVYQCLYGDFDLWVRPLESFESQAEWEGEIVERFKWIQPLSEADWLALGKALASDSFSDSSNSEV
ncbi:DUF1653 domain-containing protein [Saccharospirillum sp. MSK14-1]|uniref:DUF1653 domain-containing protein n=1 Tax=Saccharospirillum sp. MSK14-1 TaxID=1897632 RepID=UPI0018EE5C76|nr:DUF1653 domain-containing protein [Saccharospirillum sp. MSK14-1]